MVKDNAIEADGLDFAFMTLEKLLLKQVTN